MRRITATTVSSSSVQLLKEMLQSFEFVYVCVGCILSRRRVGFYQMLQNALVQHIVSCSVFC